MAIPKQPVSLRLRFRNNPTNRKPRTPTFTMAPKSSQPSVPAIVTNYKAASAKTGFQKTTLPKNSTVFRTIPSVLAEWKPPSPYFARLISSKHFENDIEDRGFIFRVKGFFRQAYEGVRQFFDLSKIPPPGMKLALAGADVYTGAFEMSSDGGDSVRHSKFGNVAAMTATGSENGVSLELETSRKELIRRLKEGKYANADINIVVAAFKSLGKLPPEDQTRSLKIAFKMIEWGASGIFVAASLCMKSRAPQIKPALKREIEKIVANVKYLDELDGNLGDINQGDYFRGLVFQLARGVDSLLLLAAQDIVDLENVTESPEEGSSEISSAEQVAFARKVQRAFIVTSWMLKFLHLEDDGGHLEDLAFLSYAPGMFRLVESRMEEIIGMKRAESLNKLREMADDLNILLDENVFPHRTKYRVKRVASAAKKLETNTSFNDTNGLRVILDSDQAKDCYRVLIELDEYFGTEGWEDMSSTMYRDYIAKPKPNGYRSLHTGYRKDGYIVEIQIRTEAMDRDAEVGSASHASYKTKEKLKKRKPSPERLAKQMFDSKLQTMMDEGVYFLFDSSHNSKNLVKLVTGSPNIRPTVLDFAFAKYFDQALHTQSSFVDGNRAHVKDSLESGQRVAVEIQAGTHLKNGQSSVSTPLAKAVLSAMSSSANIVFNFKAFSEAGKKEFDKIVDEINEELLRAHKSRFTIGTPKFNFKDGEAIRKKLMQRMGFEAEDTFYCTLATLPEGQDREKFKAKIRDYMRSNSILYAHSYEKGVVKLEIMSTSRRSVFKQLFRGIKNNGFSLQSVESDSVPKTAYYLSKISLNSTGHENYEELLNEVGGLIPHTSYAELRASNSLTVKLRLKKNTDKPSLSMDIIQAILGYGAGIRTAEVPTSRKNQETEYKFYIQLPQGQSKARATDSNENNSLYTRLDAIDGIKKIVFY